MRRFFGIIWLLLALAFWGIPHAEASKRWSGSVKKGFENNSRWIEFLERLGSEKHYYGLEAGARRALLYFSDLKTKEFAYQQLVDLVGLGFPHSVRFAFTPGDLELLGKDSFAQTYNLYKSTINLDKNMEKWADFYMKRVDQERFPQYLLYKAISEFDKKNFDQALQLLDKALALLTEPQDFSLSKKVARTMARIYFEKGDFQKSFDIYQNYLLRLNPLTSLDWLEAAWSLYRLGRLDEALGYLYNLEVSDRGSPIYLEKYVIRSLVYREKCAVKNINFLIQDFENQFGATMEGIKLGEPLNSFPLLKQIILGSEGEYSSVSTKINELEIEQKNGVGGPGWMVGLEKFLYTTELSHLKKLLPVYEDRALEKAAKELVIMGESLKFLKFDVVREKYSPDKVFLAPPGTKDEPLIEEKGAEGFLLHWIQWGDYFRDERGLYRAKLKNWCL